MLETLIINISPNECVIHLMVSAMKKKETEYGLRGKTGVEGGGEGVEQEAGQLRQSCEKRSGI